MARVGLQQLPYDPTWSGGSATRISCPTSSPCKGWSAGLWDGMNKVDISHVDNVADAHLLALDALESGKANGKAYSSPRGKIVLWDWLNDILRRLGIPPVQKHISPGLAKAVGGSWRSLENFPSPVGSLR